MKLPSHKQLSSHQSQERRPQNLGAWLLAAVSGLLAIYSCALLYEGFVAKGYSGIFTAPFPDKPAAERQFDALAPSASAAQRRAAAALLTRSAPSDPESWTATAFADLTAQGKLTPEGVTALERSYTLSFFDREQAVWRVSFSLEHWDQLTDQTREDALAEAKAALADPKLSGAMRSRLAATRNPAGRLAAILVLAGATGAGGQN